MGKKRPDDPQRPDRTFTFLRRMWGLAHALDARSKRMLTTHGVTGPQRLAIRLVGRTPGITAGQLAEALCLHPSTVTGIVRRLEERGLVARAKDTSDARRAMLVPTVAGRALDRRREGTIEQAVRRVLSRHSDAELELVERFLAELAEELLPD